LSPEGNTRIKDLPAHERPRERLLEQGAESLRDAELLAILLRTGSKGYSAVHIGEQLLREFGTLDRLARAPLEELRRIKGVGRDKAIGLRSAFTLAQRMARELRRESPVLDRPETIADFMREEVRFQEVEHLHVLLLNTRRKLIRIECISQGTLDNAIAHPRDVFRAAVAANAAAIALVHNHPSGDPTPSEADIRVTRDVIRAGQLLKIEVIDHVIIGARTPDRPKDYASLKELGQFYV
jgi:DNA repair protein RadC